MSVRIGSGANSIDPWTERIETSGNLPAATAWTIFGWAKHITFRTGNVQPIFTLEEGSFTHRQRLYWYSDNNFYVDNDAAGSVALGNPSTSGWFAWALSCAGTAGTDLKGYWRNNADVAWTTVSAAGNTFTPSHLTVGSYDNFNWTDAELRYVRMWDAVLTPTELSTEFASATAVRTANLRRNLILAAAATAGTDSSGNGYNMSTVGLIDGASEPTFPVELMGQACL